MPLLRHAFALYAVRELNRFTPAFSQARVSASLTNGLQAIRE